MANRNEKTMVSLFSGYGGLDLAVEQALGGVRVVALSDIDTGPDTVLAYHWPDVPNLKDITEIDWAKLGHVDVMAGGFCCQSVSTAGKRAGLKRGTRTGLWFNYAEGIRVCRPSLIVAENVGGLLSGASVCDEDDRNWPKRAEALKNAGLCSCRVPEISVDGFTPPDQSVEGAQSAAQAYLSFDGGPVPADLTCAACGGRVYEVVDGRPVADDARLDGRYAKPCIRALGRVLGDLANLGYDAVWRGLEAADVGAPHHRLRIFVVAWPRETGPMDPPGEPWASWNRGRDVWETGVADLFGGADVFMDSWPRSGVMSDGSVFTLPAEWLRTVRFDHSSLPTPLSRDGGHGGSMSPEAKRAGNHAVTLQDVAEKGVDVLYTPRASDGVFGRAAKSGAPLDKSGSLTTQARLFDLPGMLPTPNALYDSTKTGTSANTMKRAVTGRQLGLVDVANLLSTPNTMDMLPARGGGAREKALRRGAEHGFRRASTGNLREDVMGLGDGE